MGKNYFLKYCKLFLILAFVHELAMLVKMVNWFLVKKDILLHFERLEQNLVNVRILNIVIGIEMELLPFPQIMKVLDKLKKLMFNKFMKILQNILAKQGIQNGMLLLIFLILYPKVQWY